jgi:hypothetical protein
MQKHVLHARELFLAIKDASGIIEAIRTGCPYSEPETILALALNKEGKDPLLRMHQKAHLTIDTAKGEIVDAPSERGNETVLTTIDHNNQMD